MSTELNIMIADDNGALCTTIEQNVKNTLSYFKIDESAIVIHKAFTEHAYEHGCNLVRNGFMPNICIFDLVFNGTTGIDLYKFIINYKSNEINRPQLCIYTGVEKTYEKRQEAEVLASESGGDVEIIAKPDIQSVIKWLETIIDKKFMIERKYENDDPFDLL